MKPSDLNDLVIANRILAHEGVVDAFGHVSIRNPEDPNRYVQSRSRAPELVTADDLMEFGLAGDAIDLQGRTPYSERMIHGAIYEAARKSMRSFTITPTKSFRLGSPACRCARSCTLAASLGLTSRPGISVTGSGKQTIWS